MVCHRKNKRSVGGSLKIALGDCISIIPQPLPLRLIKCPFGRFHQACVALLGRKVRDRGVPQNTVGLWNFRAWSHLLSTPVLVEEKLRPLSLPFNGVWQGDFIQELLKNPYNTKMGMPPKRSVLFACLYLFIALMLASLFGHFSILFPAWDVSYTENSIKCSKPSLFLE